MTKVERLILTGLVLLIGRELRRPPVDEEFVRIANQWFEQQEKMIPPETLQ